MTCADCGGTAREMTPAGLARGSSVREPGEALCEGCSARRVRMVVAVDRLPDSIKKIRTC